MEFDHIWDYQENFLNDIGICKQTKINYIQALRILKEYSEYCPDWHTSAGMLKFRDYLTSNLNLGIRSATTYITVTKRFFKYLTNKQIIAYNPSCQLKSFAYQKSDRTALTKEEVKILLKTIKDSNLPTMYRDYAMVRLLAKTGMRVISLQHAKIEDLSTLDKQDIISIRTKGDQSKDNFVMLNNGLKQDILKCIGKRDSGYIFVGMGNKNHDEKLTTRHINRIITGYMNIAGIKTDTNCVHALRHFFVTEALNRGCALENIMDSVHHKSYSGIVVYTSDQERIKDRLVCNYIDV